MKTEGLQENIDDPADQQSQINVLLRRLDASRQKEERLTHELKTLALAVKHNPEKSGELAEAALKILNEHKQSPGKVIEFLKRMSDELTRAENMSDENLIDEVFRLVWGDLNMDGRPSAVLEELLLRFKKCAS